MVAISFTFFIDKVTVTASNIALSDQGWHANFSTPLKEDALGSDNLYITDRNGKQVTADVTLGNAGKTLYVKGLVPGSYTLHVKKNAFNGKTLKSLPIDEIKFTVHETIESVASAKELKAYFERAKSMQQSNPA